MVVRRGSDALGRLLAEKGLPSPGCRAPPLQSPRGACARRAACEGSHNDSPDASRPGPDTHWTVILTVDEKTVQTIRRETNGATHLRRLSLFRPARQLLFGIEDVERVRLRRPPNRATASAERHHALTSRPFHEPGRFSDFGDVPFGRRNKKPWANPSLTGSTALGPLDSFDR